MQALRRAHRLMESGRVEQAFPVFKRAAQRGGEPEAASSAGPVPVVQRAGSRRRGGLDR
jgi:hypothetical protein